MSRNKITIKQAREILYRRTLHRMRNEFDRASAKLARKVNRARTWSALEDIAGASDIGWVANRCKPSGL